MSKPTLLPERTPNDRAAITSANRDELKERFLVIFSESCNMSTTAEKLGIPRHTIYYWLHNDPAFKERFDQARIDGAEALEDVAIKRAKETSDRLIAFLLKSYRPERFGDRVTITTEQAVSLSWPEHKEDQHNDKKT